MPLAPFVFFQPTVALQAAILCSATLLFVVGAGKARLTTGAWVRGGLKMAAFGLTASLFCYLIGRASGAFFLGTEAVRKGY